VKIGVAKEIKTDEYRVALTPAGARELVQSGHDVIVETGAGEGSSFTDNAYAAAGARIASVEDVWADSELLLNNVDQPLIALKAYCQLVLGKNPVLEDIVREADVEWGRMMDERPHFERDGVLDPDDPYTTQSVRKSLSNVLERLEP